MAGAMGQIGRRCGGVVAAVTIAAALSMTAAPGAGAGVVAAVKITSVKITGTAAAPVITIKGSGFGIQ